LAVRFSHIKNMKLSGLLNYGNFDACFKCNWYAKLIYEGAFDSALLTNELMVFYGSVERKHPYEVLQFGPRSYCPPKINRCKTFVALFIFCYGLVIIILSKFTCHFCSLSQSLSRRTLWETLF